MLDYDAHIFIFARGGSKGLPNKNIKNLGGKPLFRNFYRTCKKPCSAH